MLAVPSEIFRNVSRFAGGRMNRWRRGSFAVAIGALTVGATVLAVTHQASAHGSMQNPVSRVYECFLENPEHPQTAPCQAAVAIGGTPPTQPLHTIHHQE